MSILSVVAKKLAEGRMKRAIDTGYTTDTYHGSTHALTEMDASVTNVENDWGRGIYSSNNIDDVNINYGGEGADLTARIEQETDRLEGELIDQFNEKGRTKVLESLKRSTDDLRFISGKMADLDDADAVRKAAEILARKAIKGENDGVVYPLKLNTDNFATIGGKDRTIVEGRDYDAEARQELKRSDYADEYDYEEAVNEYAFDLMNSDYDTNYQKVMAVINKYDADVNVDELVEAFDGDSVDLTRLDEIIRKSDIYAEDDYGNIISNGAVSADIIKNLGFKGIVDNTVNAKFGSTRRSGVPMEGVNEDTVHYITFEGAENQIRSRYAQFKDSSNRNLLAGFATIAVPTGAITTSMLAPEGQASTITDMAQEYGMLDQRYEQARAEIDAQKLRAIQAEREARKGMSRRELRDNPPSEALRNYMQGEALRAPVAFLSGGVRDTLRGLDSLRTPNLAGTFLNYLYGTDIPNFATPLEDLGAPLTDIQVMQNLEADKTAKDLGGMLLSPI